MEIAIRQSRCDKKYLEGRAMSGSTDSTESFHARSNVALLIIDMISDFDFKDGDRLYDQALAAARNISFLKSRAKKVGVPVIFVNDNYGKWHEDFGTYVSRTKLQSEKGRVITDIVDPRPEDLFILKPQRSGFYATPLGVLLLSMEVSNLIVTGITTDICVLFTAHDAYMRGYHVRIPNDCSAAVKPKYHFGALRFLERIAEADIRSSCDLEFGNSKTRRSTLAPHLNKRRTPNLGDFVLTIP
jgi:nicotinamidase-related amidase